MKHFFTALLSFVMISAVAQIDVDSNGNVGIGTDTPSRKLEVAGDLAVGNTLQAFQSLLFRPIAPLPGYNGTLQIESNTTPGTGISRFLTYFGTTTSGTGGQTIHDVAVGGRLGIGNTNPTTNLDIFDSNTTPSIITLRSSRNDAQWVDVGRLSAVQINDEVARIALPRGGDTFSGFLTFWTKETNGTPLTERMRISDDGNIGIGETDPTNIVHITDAQPSIRFQDTDGAGNDHFIIGNNAEFRFQSTGRIAFRHNDVANNNNTELMVINTNGDVGIGVLTPNDRLDVAGNIRASGGVNAGSFFTSGTVIANQVFSNDLIGNKGSEQGQNMELGNQFYTTLRFDADRYRLYAGGINGVGEVMSIFENGNVGIGTTDTFGRKLAVNGDIAAKDLIVENAVHPWPDYVFENDYDLLSLEEVEDHINEKGHLPNVPSAKEVEAEGSFSLGEMNKKLLEKVEELTLYLIEQNKQLKELRELEQLREQKQLLELKQLKQRIKSLEKELETTKK
jgi:hypothetical protein